MDGDHGLQVDVLGPIRARDHTGRDVTPDGVLQRRLLAMLVLRRGLVVSVATAVDVLWPQRPPRDPQAALQNHLFRLRRTLPDGVVESTGNGYRLDPSRIDLDADRLAAAVGGANGSDPIALATIDAILDRWRGPAYPELDDVDEGRAEAVRLAELRVRARELVAEHRLASGAAGDVVAELLALADEAPLRERPRALLIEALAATGRNVEALRVYDDFRRLLGAELGVEPSPSLAARHAALLTGTGGSTWRPPSRVPIPATSLIGRTALVDEIVALAGSHRVVTLVGPGGVGKTRSAIEAAHRLRSADLPVVVCELATATEASALDVVAAALVVDGRPGVDIVDRITALLADADLVLLLDNCEHVLDPIAGLVERLIASCPTVTIIATSRERLRVPAEQLCVVAPLSHVGPSAPAVELFVERARAVAPHFDPDSAALGLLEEIARRLDGLPLAIELAAARLHTHDVAEVAAGLDERFELLSSGSRTSARHGSLAATVAWSFGLLDDDLQRVFGDVSVFAGSFTAADAAAVCGLSVTAASAALHQLAERSLVTRGSDRRFVLLETLRAFGVVQLAADGRAAAVGERHARHLVEWVEQARSRVSEAADRPVLTEVDDAIPELRTALGWLLERGEVERAGRLIAALIDYGFLRLRPDVLAWAELVAAADPDDRSPQAPLVLVAGAYAAWMAGDIAEMEARTIRAERAAGGEVPAWVIAARALIDLFAGRPTEAAEGCRRAAATASDPGLRQLAAGTELLARSYAGDPATADRAADLLAEIGAPLTPCAAYVWYCAGEADLDIDVGRARQRFDRALALAEATNTAFVVGVAGASRASIDARSGDPDVAVEDYRRLLVHFRRAGMWSTQWTMLRSIAQLLARLGRLSDAAVLEGAVRATVAGHSIFGADEIALAELGRRLRAELGDDVYDAARRAGAVLDGDAAVQHGLQALTARSTPDRLLTNEAARR